MQSVSAEVLRSHLVLSRASVSPGDRAAITAAVRVGALVCVLRGAYLPSSVWVPLQPEDRHRVRVLVASELHDVRRYGEFVASHHSAAALWRLPWSGDWPAAVHTVVDREAGGRSSRSIVRHTIGVPRGIERIDEVAVTALGSTVVSIASCSAFRSSVVLADAALRRTAHPIGALPQSRLTRAVLERSVAELPLRHGSARARAVVEFASGLADRPGESHSRVSMRIARIPMPELQVELRGASGKRYFADFWWDEFNHIGEFDGKSKYSDPEFLRGRSPHQVLLDEKHREDDLRAAGHGFSRWGWQTAVSPRLLAEQLARAGIR